MAELKGLSSQPSLKPEKPESKSRGFKNFLLKLRSRFEKPKQEVQPVVPSAAVPSEPEPQQETPIPQKEPEKKETYFTRERQELGLPEERSLKEIALENERRRKEAVATFLKNKEKRKEKRFPEVTYEEKIKKNVTILEKKEKKFSFIDRAKILSIKRKILKELKKEGVPDGDKVLQLMVGWGKELEERKSSNQVVDLYRFLYEDVKKEEFKKNCREIGDVYKAIVRINEIGGKLDIDILSDENELSKIPLGQIIPLLHKLQGIPEEQFRTKLNFLKQYDFIFPPQESISKYSPDSNKSLVPIVDFIGQHQVITEEERMVFETAKRINEITEDPTRSYGSQPFSSHLNASEILTNKERLENELTILEQLVLDLYDPNPGTYFDGSRMTSDWRQQKLYQDSSSLYRTFSDLVEDNNLHSLAELIRKGFSLSESSSAFTNFFEGTEKLKNDIQKGNALVEIFDDPQKRSLILFINDLNKMTQSSCSDLALGKCSLFQSVVENQEMSEKSLRVAIELAIRSTPDLKLRASCVEFSIKQNDEIGIKLEPWRIFSLAKDNQILEKCSPEERLFWQKMLGWKETARFNIDFLAYPDFIPAFLFLNISRFNELYQGDRFTDQFLKEFQEYYQKVGEKYITSGRLDKMSLWSGINCFLLDKEKVPPSLIGLAEQIDNDKLSLDQKFTLYEILGVNYQNWFSLLTDGKPNIEFVKLILDKTGGVSLAGEFLTEKMTQALPEEDKRFWQVWKEVYSKGGNYLSFLGFLYQNREKLNEYYQNNHLNNTFLRDYYLSMFEPNNPFVWYDYYFCEEAGFFTGLSLTEKAVWKAIGKCKTQGGKKYALENIDSLKGLFNQEASPTPELILFLAKEENQDLQEVFLTPKTLESFPQTERRFWQEWLRLPNPGKEAFNQKIASGEMISNQLIQGIEIYNNLFSEIESSPSKELQKIKNQLIVLLLESQNPVESLHQIKALFEGNNLPDFAKKYRIFEILYRTREIDGLTRFEREVKQKGANLSPILLQSSELRRYDTIYRDLLKVNIESADPSLRTYLVILQEGQTLVDKFESEGLNSLSDGERRKLTRFLNRLDILFETSLLGRRQRERRLMDKTQIGDLPERVRKLRSNLMVRENQRIVDRISEMFVRPLGYDSIEGVLGEMDQAKKRAYERNLTNPRVKEGELEIAAGDLLKGINNDYFESILLSGSVARDYLGVSADSDSTPFDTDTCMVLIQDNISNVIKSSSASSYGNILILVRNRGQFVRTTQQEKVDVKYDPAHYELFPGRVVGAQHYGIRTGFPSTEVDAFIFRQDLLADSPAEVLKRQAVFFAIANNGFYIPVTNPEGKIIFTEADYQQYQLNPEIIKRKTTLDEFNPKDFVDSLKTSPYLKTVYEMSSGVAEGYSIEQHSLMVMDQFEKYFASSLKSTLLTRDQFRLMLALHDIGKSVAVYETRSTEQQHEYTKKILSSALQASSLPAEVVDSIIGLVDQDILGQYLFKGEIDVLTSAKEVKKIADWLGVDPLELLETLRIFYFCDGSSYTADAKGELVDKDSIFIFSQEAKKRSIKFSEQVETKYQELVKSVSS